MHEEAREPASPESLAVDRVEQVARASYGRLVAILAARSGDIEAAEDALADAFAKALETWPRSGVPASPEGWLLTTARNRQKDVARSAARHIEIPLIEAPAPDLADMAAGLDPEAIPDRRLALLFVCAHPAIDPSVRMPLMLQTVLGFEADRIARALAMPTGTLAQRLVRAKRRIRHARIPFDVPDRGAMPARLPFVLEAIYGAYAMDWQSISGMTVRDSTAGEALFLAELLASLLPDEPEALGLAALLSLSLSRAPARGAAAEFVPLDEQNPSTWDAELIGRGERYLASAHTHGRVGRFQLEAAIQSVHCARSATGVTDWRALRTLYSALVATAPTLGARVALAVAISRADGAAAGLAALDAIDEAGIARFQPAWAARAHLLAATGRRGEAGAAYEKAISLTTELGLRRYLERRLATHRATA
ncbi:MAG: RNA polymerase subunit sigma-70 [Gemmatimonadota bacterium]|nr:RNA polymerase subunit sigma-70 [Gemmatimonadota bacterium]